MVYCKHEFKRRFSKERKDNKWDEKAEKFINVSYRTIFYMFLSIKTFCYAKNFL